MIAGIDHVQVAAPPGCEAEARRFFGQVLGLVEIEKPEALRRRGGVWFLVGEHQLHVGVDPEFTPARKAHPAFVVGRDEFEALISKLTNAGSTVIDDEEIPGVRRFYTSDPWGNRLEFLRETG